MLKTPLKIMAAMVVQSPDTNVTIFVSLHNNTRDITSYSSALGQKKSKKSFIIGKQTQECYFMMLRTGHMIMAAV